MRSIFILLSLFAFVSFSAPQADAARKVVRTSPTSTSVKKPSVKITKSKAGHNFRLNAANGEILLRGSEPRSSKQGAEQAALSALANAAYSKGAVKLSGLTPVVKSAGSSEPVAVGEAYSNKSNANKGIKTIRAAAKKVLQVVFKDSLKS